MGKKLPTILVSIIIILFLVSIALLAFRQPEGEVPVETTQQQQQRLVAPDGTTLLGPSSPPPGPNQQLMGNPLEQSRGPSTPPQE